MLRKPEETSDFTMPSTPRPQAFSTAKRDRRPDFLALHRSPMKNDDDSSAFANVLNVSDLERDEVYCRQNWTYLPTDKFNFSVTAMENSKINPPNFMPLEDSLFQELQGTNSNSMQLSLMNQIPDNLPGMNNYLTKKQNQEIEKERLSQGIPSIQDISQALKSCDEGANSIALINEIMRSGNTLSDSSSAVPMIEYEQKDSKPLAYEDVVTFSSVEINETQLRTVHLLNLSNNEAIMRYEFRLYGNDAFKIFQTDSLNNDKSTYRISFNEDVYELNIAFSPKKIGPVTATLKIFSESGHKKIMLGGFGGKSNLIMRSHISALHASENILYFADNLTLLFELRNIGTSPAFYFINFGELEYYCYTENYINCGIVQPGRTKVVKLHINQDVSVLVNLLNFFLSQKFAEIGKISFYYGEESSRQRLKRLSRFYRNAGLTSIVSKSYAHLLQDYSEIPFNFEEITDNMSSVPLLIHEGHHQMDFKVKMNKASIINALSNIMKETVNAK